MKSTIFAAAALAAVADALPDSLGWLRIWQRSSIEPRWAVAVQPAIQPPRLNAQTVQGCFSSSGNLTLMVDNLIYNSIGGCAEKICYAKKYPVGATMGGSQCFCGYTYPPKNDIVDNDNCNYNCTGYPTEACGGINFWTVYNTGVALVVDSQPNSTTTSTTSAASTSKPTSTGTAAEVTVTATQSTSSDASKSGGTNVAGIAAGVVVGVLVVAGAIGGFFLYMRRKRNKEIEEEHRRNAAVNDFFGKPPGSSGGMSTTDSRLDPVLANRRLSDGSIADNQDYSRRILRVTNA